MPLFNVELTMKTTAVVIADDEDGARYVAARNARQAFGDDCNSEPRIHVTGEVTSLKALRDGWDGGCIPYGGDGNTWISALLATPQPRADGDV